MNLPRGSPASTRSIRSTGRFRNVRERTRPILTYDLGAVKLNAIYVPRYGDYNQFAVFGFYFSLPLGR